MPTAATAPAKQLTSRDPHLFHDLHVHGHMNTQQLAAIHQPDNWEEFNRRLRKLARAKYIVQITTPKNRACEYVLGQRGMNVLTSTHHLPGRRIFIKDTTQPVRPHETKQTDFTVSMDLLARATAAATLVDEHQLISHSLREDVRAHHGWPVLLNHIDAKHEYWVKPDSFLSVNFNDRPSGKDARCYTTEIDRGTMPLTRTSLFMSSMRKKDLLYAATIQHGVLNEIFGINFFYRLTLSPGRRRRDNVAALAREIIDDEAILRRFLYAVQPPAPTAEGFTDIRNLEWIDGRGKRVTFPF